jgi:hypothetical protein
MTTSTLGRSGIFRVKRLACTPTLSANVIIVVPLTTSPTSALSLVMMNDARQLAMHEKRLRRTYVVEVVEAAVVEAVAVEVDVEMEVVVLRMSVLLGRKQRAPTPTPTLVLRWSTVLGKCCVIRDVVGIQRIPQVFIMSRVDWH